MPEEFIPLAEIRRQKAAAASAPGGGGEFVSLAQIRAQKAQAAPPAPPKPTFAPGADEAVMALPAMPTPSLGPNLGAVRGLGPARAMEPTAPPVRLDDMGPMEELMMRRVLPIASRAMEGTATGIQAPIEDQFKRMQDEVANQKLAGRGFLTGVPAAVANQIVPGSINAASSAMAALGAPLAPLGAAGQIIDEREGYRDARTGQVVPGSGTPGLALSEKMGRGEPTLGEMLTRIGRAPENVLGQVSTVGRSIARVPATLAGADPEDETSASPLAQTGSEIAFGLGLGAAVPAIKGRLASASAAAERGALARGLAATPEAIRVPAETVSLEAPPSPTQGVLVEPRSGPPPQRAFPQRPAPAPVQPSRMPMVGPEMRGVEPGVGSSPNLPVPQSRPLLSRGEANRLPAVGGVRIPERVPSPVIPTRAGGATEAVPVPTPAPEPFTKGTVRVKPRGAQSPVAGTEVTGEAEFGVKKPVVKVRAKLSEVGEPAPSDAATPTTGKPVAPELVPPPGEGTVPTRGERAIEAQGGPEAVAAKTGRVVVEQADGTKLLVAEAERPRAEALAADGKLAEFVNGEGTSPKPAAPTEVVIARDASGAEVRTVLTDTPDKTASAVAAQEAQGLKVEVVPANEGTIGKVLAERETPAPALDTASTKPKWQMTREEFAADYSDPVKVAEMHRAELAKERAALDSAPKWQHRDLRAGIERREMALKEAEAGRVPKLTDEQMDWQRRGFVEDAINRGDAVPPSVLADYPDLAPQSPPAPAPKGRLKGPRAPGMRKRGEGGFVDVGAVVKGVTSSGAKLANLAEPARKLYERATGAVEDGLSRAIDSIPGGAAARTTARDALRPIENIIDQPVVKGGSSKLFNAGQQRRGDVSFVIGEGERRIKAFEKASRGMTNSELDAVYRWMGSEEQSLPPGMKPQAVDAATNLAAFIDELRQQELKHGAITPEVYAEYPRYLARVMREQIESKGRLGRSSGVGVEKNIARKDGYGVELDLTRAEAEEIAAEFPEKMLGGKGVTGKDGNVLVKFRDSDAGRAAFEGFVKAVTDKFETARRRLGSDATREIKAGDVGQAKTLMKGAYDVPTAAKVIKDKWAPLDAAQREAFGEITNTEQAASLTIARSARRLANIVYLKRLQKYGQGAKGGDWVMDPPPAGPGGKVNVPSDRVVLSEERWGPLRGKWMRKDIHDFVTEQATREAESFWKNISKGWRRSHFTDNLPTQLRNFASIPIMLEQAGVSPVTDAKFIVDAIRHLAKRDKVYERAVREGTLKQDLASADAYVRAADALDAAGTDGTKVAETLARVLGGDLLAPAKNVRGVKQVRGFMESTYGIPDDIVRLSKDLQLRARGMSGHELASELNASTPNYHMIGRGPRALTNVPVAGPAASFAYEMYRITANNLRRNPARLAKILLATKLMQTAGSAMTDVTDEEQRAAEQQFGNMVVPTGRDAKTGNPQFYDTRYVHPLGGTMAGPRTFGPDTDWNSYILEMTLGGESPLIGAWNELTTGKNKWGRQVHLADDPAWKRLAETWRQNMGPPLAGRHADRFAAAMKDEPYAPGRPVQDPVDVIGSALLGLTFGEMDPDVAKKAIKAGWDKFRAEQKKAIRVRAKDEDQDAVDDLTEELTRGGERTQEMIETIDKATDSRPKPR